MKIIEWPLDVNKIVANRKPKSFEDWVKIIGIESKALSEECEKSLRKWFKEHRNE